MGLFNRKKKSKLAFRDLDGRELKAGDMVLSLRYDMGKCRIIKAPTGYVYLSVESGKEVDWSRMVDASTGYQKVRKIND